MFRWMFLTSKNSQAGERCINDLLTCQASVSDADNASIYLSISVQITLPSVCRANLWKQLIVSTYLFTNYDRIVNEHGHRCDILRHSALCLGENGKLQFHGSLPRANRSYIATYFEDRWLMLDVLIMGPVTEVNISIGEFRRIYRLFRGATF